MRTTVFLFHPHLDTSVVNARLARAARDVEGVTVRDMYGLYPDEHIGVAAEQEVLLATDRIVWQFPMYWYSSPSLLKKWEDEVLTHGWAYGSTGTALHGKELLVATSPGAPAGYYAPEGRFHYSVTELLRPFQATSNLIGTRFLTPFVTTGTNGMSPETLEGRAAAYAQALTVERPVLGLHED